MVMRNKFFIVDKNYGSSHSFIDGMIKTHLIPLGRKNRIYFAKADEENKYINYLNKDVTSYIESRFKRNGIQKIFFSIGAFNYFLRNYPPKENEVFIRNELIVLLLFACYKKIYPHRYTLSFQSSFPHEESSGSFFKKLIAKSIMSISLKNTDKLYTVSELAKTRLKQYIPKKNIPIHVVPLCTDFPIYKSTPKLSSNIIRFVYIGTFSNLRRLDTVIEAFYKLNNKGVSNWHIEFYGGYKNDFLNQYPNSKTVINELVDHQLISFNGSLHRDSLINKLSQFDVGINLIPPTKMYLESSSTKLGEYLSRGLAVLSNSEIPYHQSLYQNANIGWLCQFNKDSIYNALLEVINTSSLDMQQKSENSLAVAEDLLDYKAYLKFFI